MSEKNGKHRRIADLVIEEAERDMSEQYMPTTEDVRWCYAASCDAPGTVGYDIAETEFDAWLAEHDRQVAERAWDACVASMEYEDGSPVEIVASVNPYRAAEGAGQPTNHEIRRHDA